MGYDDIPAASYDAHARLELMDEENIHAMVLYPNVGGFGSGGFLKLGEPELMLECVQAYNDFLVDWASADLNRLLPVMALPFWDVEASVKEIHRSAAKGHRAVLFGSRPETFGEPVLGAQALGSGLGRHAGGRPLDQLPHRQRRPERHRRRPRRHGREGELRPRRLARSARQPELPRQPDLRRRLRALPGPRLRVGRERRRLALLRARDVRLAVDQRRRRQGAPGVRPASRRSTSSGRSTAPSGSRRHDIDTAINGQVPEQPDVGDRLSRTPRASIPARTAPPSGPADYAARGPGTGRRERRPMQSSRTRRPGSTMSMSRSPGDGLAAATPTRTHPRGDSA